MDHFIVLVGESALPWGGGTQIWTGWGLCCQRLKNQYPYLGVFFQKIGTEKWDPCLGISCKKMIQFCRTSQYALICEYPLVLTSTYSFAKERKQVWEWKLLLGKCRNGLSLLIISHQRNKLIQSNVYVFLSLKFRCDFITDTLYYCTPFACAYKKKNSAKQGS